jgi:aspartate racemase
MKTVGLIGGMSWESSLEYYRIINEGVHARLGGVHSAKIAMVSIDFGEMEMLQRQGRWAEATVMMVDAARQVDAAGADCIVICTNTMHRDAEAVQQAVGVPLLHIADATAQKVCAAGMHRIGLLGTRFTMEEDFYKGRLARSFGLEVLIPGAEEREIVHRVIYDELVVGTINPASKDQYREVIAGLAARGAEGIILGCTEIGLLVKPEDSPVPLFDTTLIHAEAAVEFALKQEQPQMNTDKNR